VYEFWPSDLARLFRQAGISMRRPPPFEPGCDLDTRAANGLSPAIVSPDSTITYRLRPDRLDREQLSFTAITDADVESLYWFVDERFVAKADRHSAVFWQPAAGDYTVSVVDDHGRAGSQSLRVRVVQ
jgi:penicillin-binding protein 1C